MREGRGLTSHVFDQAPTASFAYSRAHRVRHRSCPSIDRMLQDYSPPLPCCRLRGSLRGCRSEIQLLDLAPATISCAKDCWVKIRGGVVAAPPFIFWVSHEIVAGRHLPVSPLLCLGASTTVAGRAYQWYENHLATLLRLSNCAWMPAWRVLSLYLSGEGAR